MADISTQLNDILTAIKGEDVRTSIWQALTNINNQINALSALVGEETETGVYDIKGTSGEFGSNLTPTESSKLLVGEYNDDSRDAVFAVGGGVSGTGANLFDVDDDGNAYVAGDLTVVGDVIGGNIGQVYTNSSSPSLTSSNNLSGAFAIGGNITLNPGTYVLIGRFTFTTGTSEGARTLEAAILTGTTGSSETIVPMSRIRVESASRDWQSLSTSAIVTCASETTYVIGGISNIASGSAGNAILTAIRIK